jgi:hypothetical protein
MASAALPAEDERFKRALITTRARLDALSSVAARLGALFDPDDETQGFLYRQTNGICGALNSLAENSYPERRPYKRYEIGVGAAACPKTGNV